MSTRGGPRVFLRKNPIIPICVQYDLYMSRKRQINIDKGQAQIASDRTKKAFDFFFFFFYQSLIIKRIGIDLDSRCRYGFADSFVTGC